MWRAMLDQMPSVSDDGVEDVDPAGKTGPLGKREPVVTSGGGYDAATLVEAEEHSDRGIQFRQQLRTEERHAVEGEADGNTTAEKLHRGQRVLPMDLPVQSMKTMARERKVRVRKNRQTVVAQQRTGAGSDFSSLPHQGVWAAKPLTEVKQGGNPRSRIRQPSPIFGSAITT